MMIFIFVIPVRVMVLGLLKIVLLWLLGDKLKSAAKNKLKF